MKIATRIKKLGQKLKMKKQEMRFSQVSDPANWSSQEDDYYQIKGAEHCWFEQFRDEEGLPYLFLIVEAKGRQFREFVDEAGPVVAAKKIEKRIFASLH